VGETDGHMIIQLGTIVQGDIRNCQCLEIFGAMEGDLVADRVVVHNGGRFFGALQADEAEVHGSLEGEILVKGLLAVGNDGSVTGNVTYGQLAIEAGGNLVANVRNIPPRLAGDYCVEVPAGGVGAITTEDVRAVDPDDDARALTFTVSRPTRGHVARAAVPDQAIELFTQADIEEGALVFVHDGSDARRGSFDVVCADEAGATTGAPQTIRVEIQGQA